MLTPQAASSKQCKIAVRVEFALSMFRFNELLTQTTFKHNLRFVAPIKFFYGNKNMISLTIADMNRMSKQDADALRAIADVYHPEKRNDRMDVGTLRAGIARHAPAAMVTLADLNAVAAERSAITPNNASTFITSAAVRTDTLDKVTTLSGTVDADGGLTIKDTAGTVVAFRPEPTLADQFAASVAKTAERVGASMTVKHLDPADNPAVGAPDQHALADQVFGGGVSLPTSENVPAGIDFTAELAKDIDAAQVFAGGVSAAIPTAMLPNPQAGQTADTATDPAGSTATATSAHVVVREAPAPNVPSGTPIPPPLPLVTPPTSQQPSDAATSASPPPPPPPAPLPAAASGAAPTTSPAQVDASGLPWDPRIHASTKTMTAKGMWTRRRGVEDSVVAEVEAQLRAAMAIPAAPGVSANAAPAPAAGAWPFPTDSSSVTGAPVPPPPAADPTTFPALMMFITDRIAAQRITQEQVQAAVQTTGLESLNLVMARPDLIPAIMTELRKVAP